MRRCKLGSFGHKALNKQSLALFLALSKAGFIHGALLRKHLRSFSERRTFLSLPPSTTSPVQWRQREKCDACGLRLRPDKFPKVTELHLRCRFFLRFLTTSPQPNCISFNVRQRWAASQFCQMSGCEEYVPILNDPLQTTHQSPSIKYFLRSGNLRQVSQPKLDGDCSKVFMQPGVLYNAIFAKACYSKLTEFLSERTR